MKRHVLMFVSLALALAACSQQQAEGNEATSTTSPPAPQLDASRDPAPLSRIKNELSLLPWKTGSYTAGDSTISYVAFFEKKAPVAIFEHQNLGEYGDARVAYFFDNDALVGFEKQGRQRSSAGAPSDGWFETSMSIRILDGKFVGGEKIVNGKPSHPDEHEVRAAGRAGALIRARAVALLDESSPSLPNKPAPQMIIRGVLDSGENIALPDGTIARIQIRDASKQDIAAQVIASEDRMVTTLPYEFAMSSLSDRVSVNAQLTVFVQIVDADDLLYVSASRTPLSAADRIQDVTVNLTKVSDFNAPDPAPGTGSGGMMITPPQSPYLCGEERILVAIESGAAFVTFDDRTTMRLPLLPAGHEAISKTFTNGKASLFVDDEPDGKRQLEFARGRRAPASCIAAT